MKSRSRENRVYTFPIALKFERHLGCRAAHMSVKFQSDTIVITHDPVASRLGAKTSYRLVNRGPDVKAGIFRKNKANVMATDVVVRCIARSPEGHQLIEHVGWTDVCLLGIRLSTTFAEKRYIVRIRFLFLIKAMWYKTLNKLKVANASHKFLLVLFSSSLSASM